MKLTFLLVSLIVFALLSVTDAAAAAKKGEKRGAKLRHVVCFKYKEGTAEAKITEINQAFRALRQKIDGIIDFEMGKNNSPEGLNKGMTHCYLVTFDSEGAREKYLPHPAHKAFVALLKPHLEDVYVIDYWAE